MCFNLVEYNVTESQVMNIMTKLPPSEQWIVLDNYIIELMNIL